MGNCVGGFKKRAKKSILKKKRRKIRLCILGIDGAGKSSAIKALASEDITGVLPTNGFTLCGFKYRKAEIIAYDLGGGERIRSIWKTYYPEVFGVIYVIDGSDRDRLRESGEFLKDVIADDALSNKPILVLLNKKDLEGCLDEIQLSDRLNLHDLANLYRAQIRVEVCQANQGTGRMMDPAMRDGFEWLLERIYDEYERLEKKVNVALKELKKRQEEERIKRQHRLAATVSSSSEGTSKSGPHTPTQPGVSSNDAHVGTSEQQIEHKNDRNKMPYRNVVGPSDTALEKDDTDPARLRHPEIFEITRPPPLLPPLSVPQTLDHSNDKGLTNGRPIMGHEQDYPGLHNPQVLTKPVRMPTLIPMSTIGSRQQNGMCRQGRVGSI